MPLFTLPIAALPVEVGLTALLAFATPALAAGEQTPPPARSIDRFCANVSEGFQSFTDVQGDTFEDSIHTLRWQHDAGGHTSSGRQARTRPRAR